MKNAVFKLIIKLICFSLIGFVLLQLLTKVFIPKWVTLEDNRMTYIMKGFYKEPKNSLDVVFMGNSDVYRGVSPIVLWDEYGIASYNYVSSGQRMWTAYYMMEECLKYQKPKLIVLNMDSSFNESQSSESNYRKAFDNMKFGVNKIKAIADPVFKNSKNEMLSYIFPITRYHSRWSELEEIDFKKAFENEKFSYKGMDVTIEQKAYEDGYSYMNKDDSKEKIEENCNKYLNKMIELCKSNNIEHNFSGSYDGKARKLYVWVKDRAGNKTSLSDSSYVVYKECSETKALGNWTQYTSCTAQCGDSGIRTLRSNVIDKYFNTSCSGYTYKYNDPCNRRDCCSSTYESAGGWSVWSSCSKSCGGGTQTRTRTITSISNYNGQSCGNRTDTGTQSCNTQSCCVPVSISGRYASIYPKSVKLGGDQYFYYCNYNISGSASGLVGQVCYYNYTGDKKCTYHPIQREQLFPGWFLFLVSELLALIEGLYCCWQ